MNKPTLHVYLAGNPVSFFTCAGLAVFLGVEAYQGNVNAFPAIFMLFAACLAGGARRQVRQYNRWKASWEEMGGETQAITRKRRAMRNAIESFGVGIVFLILLQVDYSQPGAPLFPVLFGLYVLVRIGMLLGVRRTFASRGARRRPGKAWIVTLRVRSVSRSPSVKEIYRDVPDYCQRLLAPAREG